MKSKQDQDGIHHTMDDIVFEGRNQEYGAYLLRKLYDRNMTRGIGIGTLFFLLAMCTPHILRLIQGVLPEPVVKLQMQEVRLAEVPPIDPKKFLPPPPKVVIRPLSNAVKIVEPEVKKDEEVKEIKTVMEAVAPKKEIIDSSQLIASTAPVNSTGTATGSSSPSLGGSSEGSDAGTVYSVVEEAPRFPGCEHLATIPDRKRCASDKMLQFLYKNVRYPDMAKLKGIEGKCIITFVVEKDGSISNASILQDIGSGCGQEALRVIQSMNTLSERWRPGMQRGTPVRVQYSLPISFKLSRAGL